MSSRGAADFAKAEVDNRLFSSMSIEGLRAFGEAWVWGGTPVRAILVIRRTIVEGVGARAVTNDVQESPAPSGVLWLVLLRLRPPVGSELIGVISSPVARGSAASAGASRNFRICKQAPFGHHQHAGIRSRWAHPPGRFPESRFLVSTGGAGASNRKQLGVGAGMEATDGCLPSGRH